MQFAQQLRHKIAEGQSVWGTFVVEFKSPGVPHLLAQGGMDFFTIDTEHGHYEPGQIDALIAAGKQARICPFVRVSSPDRSEITRVLDSGAEGILLPMIRTLDEVHQSVAATKYPPMGSRGEHMLRPHTNFEIPKDTRGYHREANAQLMTMVQIETLEASDLVEEIARVEGVDVLYLGSGDLSNFMGHTRGLRDSRVWDIAKRIGQACREEGKIAACHLGDMELVPDLQEMGFQLFGYTAAIHMFKTAVDEVARQIDEVGRQIQATTRQDLLVSGNSEKK